MALIKITPEELEAVAKQFQSSRGESEAIIKGLEQKIDNLQSQWEGIAQHRFYTQFNEAKSSMQKYLQLLDLISNDLNRIAQNFRQADQ